jgi:hypothetical protein
MIVECYILRARSGQRPGGWRRPDLKDDAGGRESDLFLPRKTNGRRFNPDDHALANGSGCGTVLEEAALRKAGSVCAV